MDSLDQPVLIFCFNLYGYSISPCMDILYHRVYLLAIVNNPAGYSLSPCMDILYHPVWIKFHLGVFYIISLHTEQYYREGT